MTMITPSYLGETIEYSSLHACRSTLEDPTEFLTHYVSYLRAHVKFQLDRVQTRVNAATTHADKITAVAAEHQRALAAERAAETDRNARRDEGEQLQGRLTGLKNSEEYKAQGRIEDKRREVQAGTREVTGQRDRLERDRRQIGDLEEAARKLTRRAAVARNEAERYGRDLADAAQRSGIADDGFGPVDPGDELAVTARARVAARRDDVGEIRRLLEAIRDAKSKREFREQDLGVKQIAEQEQEQASTAASERLAQTRAAAKADLSAWAGRWTELASADLASADLASADLASADLDSVSMAPSIPLGPSPLRQSDGAIDTLRTGLAEALERIGEAGAISLAEVFDARTAERQAATITDRANLQNALRDIRQRLAELRAERDAIAAEQDDAPPASDLRPASREGRPGAPLWQLVRFCDHLGDADAAAIEGALYGAGLLTAWVHPDPALTQRALAAAEADGYLIATTPGSAASADGRTLADVLVPEEQEHVAPAVITALLRSIALTDELAAAAAIPVISTKAQFSYGVHAGARPKTAPEYIGATNRASRRRARLAGQDELIARAVAEERQLTADLDQAEALLDSLRRARRELPDTRPVARAAEAVGTHAALLARARDEVTAARKAVDVAIAEVDAKTRQLRQAAAERRMPTAPEQVDAIARAAAEFESAATQLHAERVKLTQAEEDLAAQTEIVEQRRLECAEAEQALDARERIQQALEEEFRALEQTLGADVQQVLDQIREAERLIRAADLAYRELDVRVRHEHDKATAADAELRAERQALTEAVEQLHEQAAEFGEYARPDLRPLVGVTNAEPWPDAAHWPDPVRASDDLAAVLATQPADVRGVFPAGITGILDAFAAATRSGRQATEGTLKNTADRMSVALKDFTEALAACDEDYRVDWEPGVVVTVHVIDDEGRKPVAGFTSRIAERAADQGVLLEERERKVLEDELLAALAQQIHGRVIAARDLTRDMNADTRSKPMSSGIAIGIRWAQSDKITDPQRSASRLLERDSPGPERLAELRGLLREMIREYRASHPRATYREALASVLDYRTWHSFELLLIQRGESEVRLTRAKHSVMSGGEKSASIHLPLFAAANALYSSAKPDCPRLIALDEAFVGIDERYKPDLFGLAVKFDLDLFMTGHDLWVTTATVPLIAHYDMYHDKTTRTVSSLLMLWDGEQLIDASAGYADNEALVSELLGFRPTRHAPLGAAATLYAGSAAGDDPAEDDISEDDDAGSV